jgi:hypothetical protein
MNEEVMTFFGPQHHIKKRMGITHRAKNDSVVGSPCTSSIEVEECPEILRKQNVHYRIQKSPLIVSKQEHVNSEQISKSFFFFIKHFNIIFSGFNTACKSCEIKKKTVY